MADQRLANTRDDRLISFIDLAPTMLSVANVSPPEHMDGTAFMGPYQGYRRSYIHAAADRFDESPADRIRTVRDERYKYIRYYDRDLPMFYHVGYRDQQTIMRELYRLRDSDQLTDAQQLWFRESKPEIELFDTENDPHELHNLAENPAYAEVEMQAVYRDKYSWCIYRISMVFRYINWLALI